jgi:2-phospho-L-lactate guanylyltransferase (CobY/MobA/RfbA family)
MSTLLIPISPLSEAKSRLRKVFSREQIKELIISMVKDLGTILSEINCFQNVLIYSHNNKILNLAENIGLIGVKEDLITPRKRFDDVIKDINTIAVEEYDATKTIISFLDTVLISRKNFEDINSLLDNNQIVICPAVRSAGISVLGRNPPNITPTYFSDKSTPSLIAQIKEAKKHNISKIKIYDSFRAGFDVDLAHDLVLAYEYLKILNLTDRNLFKFLKKNLNLKLKKSNTNNREFKIKREEI